MWTRVLSSAVVLLAVTGSWNCNGCPSGRGVSQSLSFNQSWPSLNPWDLAHGVGSGTISFTDPNIASALQPTQCTFFADLTAAPAQFQANGDSGRPGFNLRLVVYNLHKSGPPCPTNSRSPTEIEITPRRDLAVGETTNLGAARFVVGGQTYSTGRGFFEFTLTSFDRSRGSAVGNFEAVAMNDSNPQDMLGLVITGGSFSMPIH